MATTGEQTVPPKLIARYNDMITSLGENYKPTNNYQKSYKQSGVYIEDKKNPHIKYISFHPNNKDDPIPYKIHLRNPPCSDKCRKRMLDLKLHQENDDVTIILKEPNPKFSECKHDGCLDDEIKAEIKNLNTFFTNYIKENNIVLRDTTPVKFDLKKDFPALGLNKYLEYKLKYFLLKSLFEK